MNRYFLEQVQLHERAWGSESYLNRPDLSDIMDAGVVVFWRYVEGQEARKDNGRYRISLHDDLRDVEREVSKLVFRADGKPPSKRFVKAYVNGEEYRIQGVRLQFRKVIRD